MGPDAVARMSMTVLVLAHFPHLGAMRNAWNRIRRLDPAIVLRRDFVATGEAISFSLTTGSDRLPQMRNASRACVVSMAPTMMHSVLAGATAPLGAGRWALLGILRQRVQQWEQQRWK